MQSQPKPRLRLTSKGWYRLWLRWLEGPALPHLHPMPNVREVWIGPYETVEAAFNAIPKA